MGYLSMLGCLDMRVEVSVGASVAFHWLSFASVSPCWCISLMAVCLFFGWKAVSVVVLALYGGWIFGMDNMGLLSFGGVSMMSMLRCKK